jgi:hypothetical protein
MIPVEWTLSQDNPYSPGIIRILLPLYHLSVARLWISREIVKSPIIVRRTFMSRNKLNVDDDQGYFKKIDHFLTKNALDE